MNLSPEFTGAAGGAAGDGPQRPGSIEKTDAVENSGRIDRTGVVGKRGGNVESRFGGGRSPAVAILVTMILLLVGVGYYGSVESLRGAVGGQSIAVLDPVVDLGTIPGGEIHHTQVRIRNLTHGPIRLVGARSTCDCIVPVRVPVVIGAGEVLRLPVSIRAPAVGQFELALARFTERVDEQPQIVIRGSASPAAKLVPESTGEPLAPESDARFTPPQQD